MYSLNRRLRSFQVSGFSLIELLVVVAIVGILGAVAYPSYLGYVQDSRRSDGKAALLTLANEQEKWHLGNGTYAGTLASVWGSGTTSLEDYYTLSIPTATAAAFTVRAVSAAGTSQAQDTSCLCFELDSTNLKTAHAATECTGADTGPTCW